MDIKPWTIPHPNIPKREVTLILIDNKLDEISARFLIHEARYGGRFQGISGKTSHKTRAIKIAELYLHLDDRGLSILNATEGDVKMIRNAMLHWDINDSQDKKLYSDCGYSKISNDAMNQKIGLWFKFYKYLDSINVLNDMVMTTKWVRNKRKKSMLSHLDSRTGKKKDLIQIWSLRVKPSPRRMTYHAISRTEFENFKNELQKIDPVFGTIAYFIVETGLRIDAALNINIGTFKKFLKLLNDDLNFNECQKIDYENKGGEIKQFDLPLRTIQTVQNTYLSTFYLKRMKLHDNNSSRGKFEFEEDVVWLLKNGRKVNYSDVQKAFVQASKALGRTEKRITPHWLRHTFATWTLIDFSFNKNTPLENTGVTPNPMFLLLLRDKLGHASKETTMRYIATALELMGVTTNRGPIMSFRTFSQDKNAQELVKQEAIHEFGDTFSSKKFNVFDYALSRGIAVIDEETQE